MAVSLSPFRVISFFEAAGTGLILVSVAWQGTAGLSVWTGIKCNTPAIPLVGTAEDWEYPVSAPLENTQIAHLWSGGNSEVYGSLYSINIDLIVASQPEEPALTHIEFDLLAKNVTSDVNADSGFMKYDKYNLVTLPDEIAPYRDGTAIDIATVLTLADLKREFELEGNASRVFLRDVPSPSLPMGQTAYQTLETVQITIPERELLIV